MAGERVAPESDFFYQNANRKIEALWVRGRRIDKSKICEERRFLREGKLREAVDEFDTTDSIQN